MARGYQLDQVRNQARWSCQGNWSQRIKTSGLVEYVLSKFEKSLKEQITQLILENRANGEVAEWSKAPVC